MSNPNEPLYAFTDRQCKAIQDAAAWLELLKCGSWIPGQICKEQINQIIAELHTLLTNSDNPALEEKDG